MKIRFRQFSARNNFSARPSCPTEIQWWRKRWAPLGSQAPFSANRTQSIPRALSESATANGITPPPAISPTGDEISKAADVMAPAAPWSMFLRLIGRKAERAMLAVADKAEDFGDRRIRSRQRLHRTEPFGEHTRSVQQLLIERTKCAQPLAGEFAALHAADIEPL